MPPSLDLRRRDTANRNISLKEENHLGVIVAIEYYRLVRDLTVPRSLH